MSWPDDSTFEEPESTRRFSDPNLLAREKKLAENERSSPRLRSVPEREPSVPPPLPAPIRIDAARMYVDPNRVRALYELFVYCVGPAAKPIFEVELRALGVRPSKLTARNFDALVERLSSRIPVASSRARFLAQAADVEAIS